MTADAMEHMLVLRRGLVEYVVRTDDPDGLRDFVLNDVYMKDVDEGSLGECVDQLVSYAPHAELGSKPPFLDIGGNGFEVVGKFSGGYGTLESVEVGMGRPYRGPKAKRAKKRVAEDAATRLEKAVGGAMGAYWMTMLDLRRALPDIDSTAIGKTLSRLHKAGAVEKKRDGRLMRYRLVPQEA